MHVSTRSNLLQSSAKVQLKAFKTCFQLLFTKKKKKALHNTEEQAIVSTVILL